MHSIGLFLWYQGLNLFEYATHHAGRIAELIGYLGHYVVVVEPDAFKAHGAHLIHAPSDGLVAAARVRAAVLIASALHGLSIYG